MKVLFFLLVCTVFSFVNGKTVPDYFPTCKRNDPQLERCLFNLIEELRPRLKDGIPELNIPSLEPFTISSLYVNNTLPNVQLKATIKNVKAFGGSDFKIEKFKLNTGAKYPVHMKIAVPRLEVTADYETRGSGMVFKDLNGRGKFAANLTGIAISLKGAGKIITKNGVEYLQADKVIIKLKIDDGKIEIQSATGSETARAATTLFNSSPKAVLDLLNPVIEENGSVLLKNYVNAMFESIPLNEVLIKDT